MKAVVLLVGLCATGTFALKKNPTTCPAVIFEAKYGKVRDGKNYVNGKAPNENEVLYITDLTKKGVVEVRVPANKQNHAADIIIKDGMMVIEAGAEYRVSEEVKDCGYDGFCGPSLDKANTFFDYHTNQAVTCGKKKCPKTCNKQTCDYWGAEEDYSCKSLEDEYGCDCYGCECEIDHVPCSSKLAKKKCNGKTCDEWTLLSGISCAILEKDLGCSCIGCECKPPPVCDAKAIKKCTDAYKIPCTKGKKGPNGIKCGACVPGYESNGKGDCDQVKVYPKDNCGNDKKKQCGKKDFVGDGYCDDENNNAGCGWDKGDCCGVSKYGKDKQMSYCTKCECLDCNHKKKGDKCVDNIQGHCGAADYKGDGNCDDNNNNAGCAWDGGDCCGNDVKKTYCKECKCKDCTAKAPPGDACVKSAKKNCKLKEYKGDGNCDDDNNNAGCAWDGGDCCKEKLVRTYCKKCECLDCTKQKNCPQKGKSCGAGQYKGDGNCDDNNNICSCDWDGGDCCGTSVKKTYCKECKCLDPNYKAPACGAPDYVGDGNCDDENNNENCNFDKGDCCGLKVVKTYCKECKCKDPNYKAPACGAPDYVGDGNCDDENNNESCNFDKGDCCGPKVVKTYCKECKCKDPNYKPSCGLPDYKGDGNCDDENNLKECEYDGGDCCGSDVKKTYCKQCKCLDPAHNPNCLGKCGAPDYVGDGNCDDQNNNCACKYDGGDCCLEKVVTTYCKDCSCVDPKKKQTCNGKCGNDSLVGDGFCDDNNNNCGCKYDGGDCCGTNVKKTYCKDCHCINPKPTKKK